MGKSILTWDISNLTMLLYTSLEFGWVFSRLLVAMEWRGLGEGRPSRAAGGLEHSEIETQSPPPRHSFRGSGKVFNLPL